MAENDPNQPIPTPLSFPDQEAPPDPLALGPGQAPPDLGAAQAAATPVLKGSPGSKDASNPNRLGMPLLIQMISDQIKPRMEAPAPGQLARPVSRSDEFNQFLGQFAYSFASAMGQAGHGPGSFGRGLAAGVEAPLQYNAQQQQLQQQQSETQLTQAKAAQTEEQTRLAGQMVTLPNGMTLPMSALSNYFKGSNAAQISAQSKMDLAELNSQAKAGTIKFVKPMVDPQTNKITYGGFNASGEFVKQLAGWIDPSTLAKTTTSGQWLSDGMGGFQLVQKSSTSAPVIPGPSGFPRPSAQPTSPAGPRQQLQGKVPALGAAAGGATNAPVQPSGGKRVYGNNPLYAFDPKSGETILTTGQEVVANGYSNPRKVTAKEIQEDTQLNNRLTDVAQKITRYEQTLNTPLSERDKGNIAGVMTDLKLDTHGVSIPFDRVNAALNAENIKGMSQAAKDRVIAYFNARESMVGYQRVLSGSGRSSEKAMDLNLQALPNPSMPEDFGRSAIGQFKENLTIAGQGLPKMPGIKRAKDILNPPQINVPRPFAGQR